MIIQLDLAIQGYSWEKEFVEIGTMQYIKQDGQTTLFLVKEDADAGKLSNIVGFQELENGEILLCLLYSIFIRKTNDITSMTLDSPYEQVDTY